MSGHQEVRRVHAEATEKLGEYFVIKVVLNIAPDWEWITCFKTPHEYQDNDAHPKNVKIVGAELYFHSPKQKLEDNVKWLDKYISQANECYRRKIEKQKEELKTKKEEDTKTKEELGKINKMLTSLQPSNP